MRIEGMLPQQLHILAKAALESLNIGDFIQGRVVSVKEGMLLMKLMDGSSFTASISGDVDIPEGTSLTLQIGEKIGDRLTARIVNREPQPVTAEAGQSLTSRIGEQLKAFGGKATEEFISKVIELVGADPSLDIGKASFLVANRMDHDTGMRDMIIKLAQNEFQIDANLASMKEVIAGALPKIDSASLEALLRPIMENQIMEKAVSSLADRLVQVMGKLQEVNAGSQSAQLPARPDLAGDLAGRLTEMLANAGLPSKAPGEGTVMNLVREALAAIKNPQNPPEFIAAADIPQNPPGAQSDEIMPDVALRDAISEFLSSMDEIQKNFGMKQKPEPSMIKQVVEKLFDDAFIKAENGIADPVDIGEKVKALKNALAFADEAMRLVDPKSAQTLLPMARELQNVLQFFNQAHTYHAFFQMPLVINNHQTSGELYIMKRKSKRGRIDPNQFTLFISLNTQNLGLVETFLNASNRCVTINFRVEDEALADFFRSHYKMLYEVLNKKGYTLAEMKCRLHSEKRVNLLDAVGAAEDTLGMNARIDLKI